MDWINNNFWLVMGLGLVLLCGLLLLGILGIVFIIWSISQKKR
jgi:hypothetical protein